MEKTTLLKTTTGLGLAGLAGLALQGATSDTGGYLAQSMRALAVLGIGISLALTPQAVLNATDRDRNTHENEDREQLQKISLVPLVLVLAVMVMLLTANTAKPIAIMAAVVAGLGAGAYFLATPFLYPKNALPDRADNWGQQTVWLISGGMLIHLIGATSVVIMVGSGRSDWGTAVETWAFMAILASVMYQVVLLPAMTLKWVWEEEEALEDRENQARANPPQSQAEDQVRSAETPAGNGIFAPLHSRGTPREPIPGPTARNAPAVQNAQVQENTVQGDAGRFAVRTTPAGIEFRERPSPGEPPGEERPGEERPGEERPGEERPGQERPGQEQGLPENQEREEPKPEGTMMEDEPEQDDIAAPY